MTIYILWDGGNSHVVANQFNKEDVEQFESIAAAKRDFKGRLDDPYYPCIEHTTQENGGPSAWIFYNNPYQKSDLYPDFIMEFGPRGGVIIEPA